MSPLPDYLEEQEDATILARMKGRVDADYDTTEGSFVHDMLAPAALELAIADDRLRLLFDWGFAQTTFGEFLDRRAEERGLIRRPAVTATGEVQFTGDPGIVIVQGTEVTTPSIEEVPIQRYTTDVEVVIPAGGVVVVAITAVEGGAGGNVAPGAISLLAEPTDGIDGVTNLTATTGGLDTETDEALLARYLERVRNPGSSGNVADYVNWALEVPGVGDVAVVPLEDGPGTVTVAIVDADKQPPDPQLVTDVQEYIAPDGPNGGGKAPIGANVTVEGATAVVIDVNADLTIDPGFVEADVQAAAIVKIEEYLNDIAFEDDNDVRHARIVTALLDTPGVTDAQAVEIRTGANPFGVANIVIGVKEVATRGVVTLT